jgi:hypothetical protein
MWVLNAGVPLNLVLDKIIELKKGGN